MEITYLVSIVLFILGFHIGMREAENGLTLREFKNITKRILQKIKGPKQS